MDLKCPCGCSLQCWERLASTGNTYSCSYRGIFEGDLGQLNFLLLDYSSDHHIYVKELYCKGFICRVRYLRSSIGHIQVMQGDILDNFLLFVHVTLWQGNILFSFKVKFRSIDITPALPLRRSKEEKPRYRISFSAKTLSDMNLKKGLVHNSSPDKLQLTIQTSHPA